MFKRIHFFLAPLTLVLVLVSGSLTAQNQFILPKPTVNSKNNITVGVIPQVELISIIQTISKYPTVLGFLMAADSSHYKVDVLEHFSPYKNHPAVQMFDRLSLQPRMLNFSAPSNIMLYTDAALNLRKDIELEDFVVQRAGGMDSLLLFLDLLKDFAVSSSFNKFYLQHQDFYQLIINNTINNMGSVEYVAELENFYGTAQKSYNIILVSLYNTVGFGNSLICANNKREIYNTMGPRKLIDGVQFFGDEDYLKYMIRHEFSHPFVNPLTEKNWDNEIKACSNKYDSIPENARKKVCGDWQECINEFTIRAVTTQIAFNESDKLGREYYEKEKSRGVSYLDHLIQKIEHYQQNRNIYPTFESYYSIILDVYKSK